MCLKDVLSRALVQSVANQSAAETFLGGHRGKARYAIGKNAESLSINRLVPLDGIIDDHAVQGEIWNGIPLLHTNAVRKDGLVVNCSTSIRPVDVLDHLAMSGFCHVIGLTDLICVAGGSLAWPDFVARQRVEMDEHISAWQCIYDALADDISKKTLRDVLSFRVSADPVYMREYSVRIHDQYFEDFMGYRNEIFVDAGGFDGDTAEEFAKRCGDYRKILLFEPSVRNMSLARRRLSGLRDIDFFPIGLSDSPGVLRFDQDNGSASSINDAGGEEIRVDTLDAVVSEPVSFIKMDLEGWELPALEGARRHIRDNKPKLAIAAYHGASDLRRIYRFIESFGHDYRPYLRHYTQGWSETVLFFRPEN